MKLPTTALLVAVLAPALSLHSAHAATEAAASVSIVNIELIDLTPDDGIAPSLQLIPKASQSAKPWTSIESQSLSKVGDARLLTYQAQAWQPIALETSAGDRLHASATVGGTSLATLSTSATAIAGDNSDFYSADATASAPLQFLLSPNSSVSITFDLSVRSAAESGLASSVASAAMIDEVGPRGWSTGPRISFEHWDFGSSDPDIGQPVHQQFTGTLSSGAEANYFDLFMYTRASVSPVPEPSTWGMLLAGLGLVGAVARRARAKRAA